MIETANLDANFVGQRFAWEKGNHTMLYGLDRLNEIKKLRWVLLVEGESDCWTLWSHPLPALGIPGKSVRQPAALSCPGSGST